MLKRHRAWSGALSVLIVTVGLVILDLGDGSVRGYWSRHSFTASVVSGLLVLLLTVLVVDRVTRIRQLRDQSRAVAAQAAVIVAQADRAADAITRSSIGPTSSEDDRDEASQELRTFTQMLLTSAPLLIEAKMSRTFLEAAQRTAAQLFRARRDNGDEAAARTEGGVTDAVAWLHQAATPLLEPLGPDRQALLGPDGVDPRES